MTFDPPYYTPPTMPLNLTHQSIPTGAPSDHKIVVTSVSQTEKVELCQRKWWFDKVAQVKEPPKRHFLVGGEFHAAMERLALGEELWPWGWDSGLTYSEAKWIRWAAERGQEVGIVGQADPLADVEYPICYLVGSEHLEVGLPKPAPFHMEHDEETGEDRIRPDVDPDRLRLPPLVGKIDIRYPDQIVDHKSAKNKRWAITAKAIPKKIQTHVYGIECLRGQARDRFRATYNVFLKDASEDPYQVSAWVTRKQSIETWHRVCLAAEIMAALRVQYPVDKQDDEHITRVFPSVPFDTKQKACGAYGGCPYKDLCYGRCDISQYRRRLEVAKEAMKNPNQAGQPTRSNLRSKSFGLNL